MTDLVETPGDDTPEPAEVLRLREVQDDDAPWMLWGPYLAEREWGTVREDYSAGGEAWEFFPHDHARSRVYRWVEDGLLGISDKFGLLCFALSLWNERDPILKDRLFGLTGHEGNHGEDVKECYYYLDSTPTHSYMRALYKYPQRAFPYAELVEENRRRGRDQPEYELADTGAFDEDRYFDVQVEYAKIEPEDIAIRISVTNRGPEAAPLHLLPTLWFRNTWAWGQDAHKPLIEDVSVGMGLSVARVEHFALGEYWFSCEGDPRLLFTDNETNNQRLWGVANHTPFVKDGINAAVVDGAAHSVSPDGTGTKVAAHYHWTLSPGETVVVRLRLARQSIHDPLAALDDRIAERQREADEFYAARAPQGMSEAACAVQRQAFAGLLWSKQFYHYDIETWLQGDPAGPPPPPERLTGRNSTWFQLDCREILSMPDTWEYPWFAAWDLAFHCIPLAMVDPEFAKRQLILLGREWYMHPSGQLPAYEWDFGDVNPPVQAWAALRVYRIERQSTGRGDREFLERVFQKLLLYFTWWVNRKDAHGLNVFQGGFLGLDNIGVFNRSTEHPGGGHLEQADGTAWMGMFCLSMLEIAIELAVDDPAYEDIATKFFEHFLYIADALNNLGRLGFCLWDDDDGFFYDHLHLPSGQIVPLRVRSLVGLIPMLAVQAIEPQALEALPAFSRRLEWVLDHRPEMAHLVSRWHVPGAEDRRLLTLVRGQRLQALLKRMLDPEEFLSDYGIRSVSKAYENDPYVLQVNGASYSIDYEPGESRTGLFGGNSNWRGPVWFPINYLLVEALREHYRYYGDAFQVELPTGSDPLATLAQVADDLSRRLTRIFLPDEQGRRPVYGDNDRLQNDPNFRDLVLFYEYFHGDTGAGLGASHQTGWTALVAPLLDQTIQIG